MKCTKTTVAKDFIRNLDVSIHIYRKMKQKCSLNENVLLLRDNFFDGMLLSCHEFQGESTLYSLPECKWTLCAYFKQVVPWHSGKL